MGWIFLAVVAALLGLLAVWFRHITLDVDSEYRVVPRPRGCNVAGYPPQREQEVLLSIHRRVASSLQPGTAKPGVATP
jgi:hypothetical protein